MESAAAGQAKGGDTGAPNSAIEAGSGTAAASTAPSITTLTLSMPNPSSGQPWLVAPIKSIEKDEALSAIVKVNRV